MKIKNRGFLPSLGSALAVFIVGVLLVYTTAYAKNNGKLAEVGTLRLQDGIKTTVSLSSAPVEVKKMCYLDEGDLVKQDGFVAGKVYDTGFLVSDKTGENPFAVQILRGEKISSSGEITELDAEVFLVNHEEVSSGDNFSFPEEGTYALRLFITDGQGAYLYKTFFYQVESSLGSRV